LEKKQRSGRAAAALTARLPTLAGERAASRPRGALGERQLGRALGRPRRRARPCKASRPAGQGRGGGGCGNLAGPRGALREWVAAARWASRAWRWLARAQARHGSWVAERAREPSWAEGGGLLGGLFSISFSITLV
jgi:hypothetical protein